MLQFTRMINRKLHNQVRQSLSHFPAVGLIGARQVGKTTLAKMISQKWPGKTLWLDLEKPSDHTKLDQAEFFLGHHSDKLVIIDEVQMRSDIFPTLRSLIDIVRRPGRFLLLGSSSPSLIRQSGESLAGRIAYHELTPFLLCELSNADTHTLWLRGGFPDSFRADTDELSIQWRENFITTYLQRDLDLMGYDTRMPAMKMRRLWQMLAHFHGQLLNLSQLATNMDSSRQTVSRYLDILQETFMLRLLQPYHANIKKRLIKSPKIYIRDCGLFHTLLNINSFDELSGHKILGASWEGFCLEQILSLIPSSWQYFFFRSQSGAEVDLILQKRFGEPPIFVEFKYSQAPKPTKGFWQAKEDLKPSKCFIIYPGTEEYPIAEDVMILPLTEIGAILA